MSSKKKTGKRVSGNPAKRRPLTSGDLYGLNQPSGNANPLNLGGAISGPGGPRDHGAVVIDATDSILLDDMMVATMDGFKDGISQGDMIFMTLGGRVNKKTERAQVGFAFGSDGAAALITELLAVSDRFGAELLRDVTERLVTLKKEGNIDLRFLLTAIELAIEEATEDEELRIREQARS